MVLAATLDDTESGGAKAGWANWPGEECWKAGGVHAGGLVIGGPGCPAMGGKGMQMDDGTDTIPGVGWSPAFTAPSEYCIATMFGAAEPPLSNIGTISSSFVTVLALGNSPWVIAAPPRLPPVWWSALVNAPSVDGTNAGGEPLPSWTYTTSSTPFWCISIPKTNSVPHATWKQKGNTSPKGLTSHAQQFSAPSTEPVEAKDNVCLPHAIRVDRKLKIFHKNCKNLRFLTSFELVFWTTLCKIQQLSSLSAFYLVNELAARAKTEVKNETKMLPGYWNWFRNSFPVWCLVLFVSFSMQRLVTPLYLAWGLLRCRHRALPFQ